MRQGKPLRPPRLAMWVTVVIAAVGLAALIVSLVWGPA
jgi:hypothetical protein